MGTTGVIIIWFLSRLLKNSTGLRQRLSRMARATLRQRSSAVKRAVSSANVTVARARVRLRWPIPCGVPRPTLRRCARSKVKSQWPFPWLALRQSNSPGKPCPVGFARKMPTCFVALLGLVDPLRPSSCASHLSIFRVKRSSRRVLQQPARSATES